MKQRKRCLVVAQGFYEWLKKGPGGKEKIPAFCEEEGWPADALRRAMGLCQV